MVPYVFILGSDMVERRIEVVGRLKVLEESAAPLISFLQNPALVQELRSDKHYNLQMLQDRYQVIFLRLPLPPPLPPPLFSSASFLPLARSYGTERLA